MLCIFGIVYITRKQLLTQSSKLDILIVGPVGGVETSGDLTLPAGSFFAFTAYNTSMDCISLVCLFTINETTNGSLTIFLTMPISIAFFIQGFLINSLYEKLTSSENFVSLLLTFEELFAILSVRDSSLLL